MNKMLNRRTSPAANDPIGELLPMHGLPETASASFAATRSYGQHRVENAERQARQWKIAGMAGMAMGLCGLACVPLLLPLKRTVDHFWIADRTTGVIEQMPSFEKAAAEAPQSFDVWFGERYVTARERWLPSTAKGDHDIVEWSSSPIVRAKYEAETNSKNADSPDRRLGDKGSITIEPYAHDLNCSGKRCDLRVYFRRTEQRDGDTQLAKPQTWFADVEYEKHPELIPPAGRMFNPDGMIVTHYQSQEYSAR